MPGPVPKRSNQRRRANKPDTPIRKAAPKVEAVEIPPLPDGLNPLAVELYDSLKQSGQSTFFEPSDWAAARFAAVYASHCLEGKPSAFMFAQVWMAFRELGATEAARRRMRIEIERDKPAEVVPEGVSRIAEFRKRAQG